MGLWKFEARTHPHLWRMVVIVVVRSDTATRGSSGFIGRAALLAVWIGLTDLWLKTMARAGGCTDAPGMAKLLENPWVIPGDCPGRALAGEAVLLAPAVQNSGPFGMSGETWGFAVLGLAAVLTVLVARWRWRDPGDILALGVLWGGCLVLALPRVLGEGAGVTELTVLGVGLGIGALTVTWALAWLAWRFVAEARA